MKGKNTTFITRQKRWPKNRSKVWADTREIIIAGTHPLLRDKGGYHHARRSRGGAGGSYYRGGNASYGARYNSDYEQPPQEGDLRQTGAYYRNGYTDTRPYYSANSRHYQAQPSPRYNNGTNSYHLPQRGNSQDTNGRTTSASQEDNDEKESSPDTRTCRQIIHANNRWALAAPAAEMVAVGTAALAAPATGFRHHLQYRL